MSEGLSTRTAWRELSKIHELLPREHKRVFGVPADDLHAWCNGDAREAYRAIAVLEAINVLRWRPAVGGFLEIELLKSLKHRSIEELYGGPEPWGRVESC